VVRNARDRKEDEVDIKERVVLEHFPLMSTNAYKHFKRIIIFGADFIDNEEISDIASIIGVDISEVRYAKERAPIIQAIGRSRLTDKVAYILTNIPLSFAKDPIPINEKYDPWDAVEDPADAWLDFKIDKMVESIEKAGKRRVDNITDKETLKEAVKRGKLEVFKDIDRKRYVVPAG
jgi:hypothetical protein